MIALRIAPSRSRVTALISLHEALLNLPLSLLFCSNYHNMHAPALALACQQALAVDLAGLPQRQLKVYKWPCWTLSPGQFCNGYLSYRYTDPGLLVKPCTLVHLRSNSTYTIQVETGT